MKWMVVVVLALASPVAADKPAANKAAADVAELWLRYLGPAADTKEAQKRTADSLYVMIDDGTEGHDKCNGNFTDKAKIKATLECMLSNSASLLEYDFWVPKAKEMAKLPAAIQKDKTKLSAFMKSALIMFHEREESGQHEWALIALVKGKNGKPVVTAVWIAVERDGGDGT
jgi:hypothetical protein